MGKTEVLTITWKCDRCGVEKSGGKRKPSSWDDAWSYLKIDQDAGWDYHGSAWAPRMREPMLLCGNCTSTVIEVLDVYRRAGEKS